MDRLPPLLLSKNDAEHLKVLTIFHYIVAGLAILGIGFLGLHFLVMNAIFGHPEMWKNANNAPVPPAELFSILKWVYVFVGFALVAAGILNCLSACCLQQRRHRTFSLVVAGLNCLQIPFGMVLGVFTLIVLCRESVRESYADS